LHSLFYYGICHLPSGKVGDGVKYQDDSRKYNIQIVALAH